MAQQHNHTTTQPQNHTTTKPHFPVSPDSDLPQGFTVMSNTEVLTILELNASTSQLKECMQLARNLNLNDPYIAVIDCNSTGESISQDLSDQIKYWCADVSQPKGNSPIFLLEDFNQLPQNLQADIMGELINSLSPTGETVIVVQGGQA